MLTKIVTLTATPLDWFLYFAIGTVIFYFVYGLEVYMEGGSAGRHRIWFPFQNLWSDFLDNIPGGMARKEARIREKVASWDSGCFISLQTDKSWEYSDIRREGNYREVAKAMYQPAWYFWGVQVGVYFFLWPLVVLVIFLLAATGILYSIGGSLMSLGKRKA